MSDVSKRLWQRWQRSMDNAGAAESLWREAAELVYDYAGQIERLYTELNEAREAARWLLPFTVNTPHTQTALDRWPWLEEE